MYVIHNEVTGKAVVYHTEEEAIEALVEVTKGILEKQPYELKYYSHRVVANEGIKEMTVYEVSSIYDFISAFLTKEVEAIMDRYPFKEADKKYVLDAIHDAVMYLDFRY